MAAFLRFNGAVEREPAIDAWLDRQPPELGSIARIWFTEMRQCGTDVRELIHDGCPTACVEDAPFAYVNVYKALSTSASSMAHRCPIPPACWRARAGTCATSSSGLAWSSMSLLSKHWSVRPIKTSTRA